MKRATLFLVVLMLVNCATVGKDISQEKISNIKKGVTTEQSLISYFGNPSSQTVDSDGNRFLIWSYGHAVAFGPVEGKALMVKLDKSGLVESYTTTSSTTQPVILK